ncbi:TPA: hypothetical protein ACJG67_003385 [Salmonella enterica subsp. enterica serovar Kottbus]
MSALFYINLHKILVTPVVVGMMFITGNMSAEACIYLAVHGTYSLLWLMKEHFYPDRRFMEPVPTSPVRPYGLSAMKIASVHGQCPARGYPQPGRISALTGRKGRLRVCMTEIGV